METARTSPTITKKIYFVLQGAGTLRYGTETHPLRANDFTYLAPGLKHGFANNSGQSLRVLVMGFDFRLTLRRVRRRLRESSISMM